MADFVRAKNVKRYKIKHEPLNTDFKTLYRFDRDNVHALVVYFLGSDHVETRGGALSAEQNFSEIYGRSRISSRNWRRGRGSSKYSFKNYIRSHDKNFGNFQRVDKISIYMILLTKQSNNGRNGTIFQLQLVL
jgi:hypothetical protein